MIEQILVEEGVKVGGFLVTSILSVFLPWLWLMLRKNAKIKQALDLLRVDSEKEAWINQQAIQAVKWAEEFARSKAKEAILNGKKPEEAKLPPTEKLQVAVDALTSRVPGIDREAAEKAVGAALVDFRAFTPSANVAGVPVDPETLQKLIQEEARKIAAGMVGNDPNQ